MAFTEKIIKAISERCIGKKNIQFSVGILSNGQEEMKLFGEQGEVTEFRKYNYEIGSITKTFTGLLLAKAIEENKVNLKDSISKYITELDSSKYYPTLERLASHTSGCPADPEEYDLDPRYIKANPFFAVTREEVIEQLKNTEFENKVYPFNYSNFGCSIVGYVLERVYNEDFDTLLKELLKELDLNETYTHDVTYDLNGFNSMNENCGNWKWHKGSAYCPAGYMNSNISDMLKYAKAQLDNEGSWNHLTHKTIGTMQEANPRMETGLFWFKIPARNIVWHNGGTGCFSSIICVDKNKENIIVAFSNYHDDTDMTFILGLLASM